MTGQYQNLEEFKQKLMELINESCIGDAELVSLCGVLLVRTCDRNDISKQQLIMMLKKCWNDYMSAKKQFTRYRH